MNAPNDTPGDSREIANSKAPGRRPSSSEGGFPEAPALGLDRIARTLSISQETLAGLDLLATPLWLWGPDSARIEWGNSAAVEFWGAESLAQLQDRSSNIAESTKQALVDYARSSAREKSTSGQWIAVREGRALNLHCRFTAMLARNQCVAVLVEPQAKRAEPTAAEAANGSQTELLEKIRLANERFASVAASIPGVVYQRCVTPDGDIRYTYISEGASDLFGVSPEEILADPQALFDCHGSEYRATFRERLLKASRELTMWNVEAQIITREGEKKWTHAIARPNKQPDGSVLWDGVILDATRIKKAEFAATAAAAHTRRIIVESLSQGFVLFDPNDCLVIRNSAYLALHPHMKDIAVEGATYDVIVHAEVNSHKDQERPGASEIMLQDRLEGHNQPKQTIECLWADDRWILMSEHRTFDGSTVVFYTDMTDIKQREEDLQRLNAQLDIALENMAQGLCVFDGERKLVLANRQYVDIFDLPEELTQVGVHIQTHIEHIFSKHRYNENLADRLVKERLKHLDSGEYAAYYLNLPDGRTIEATHRPLPDGGVVETFSEW